MLAQIFEAKSFQWRIIIRLFGKLLKSLTRLENATWKFHDAFLHPKLFLQFSKSFFFLFFFFCKMKNTKETSGFCQLAIFFWTIIIIWNAWQVSSSRHPNPRLWQKCEKAQRSTMLRWIIYNFITRRSSSPSSAELKLTFFSSLRKKCSLWS